MRIHNEMEGEREIASGDGGPEASVHWHLSVGGSESRYGTTLRTRDGDGVVVGGGMGGPKPTEETPMSVYLRRSEGKPVVVVRSHPTIDRVVLRMADGTSSELAPCHDRCVDELWFRVVLFRGDESPAALIGYSLDGDVRDTHVFKSVVARDNSSPTPGWIYGKGDAVS
jgi:hypothetical protein